jgi:hypothetical protein
MGMAFPLKKDHHPTFPIHQVPWADKRSLSQKRKSNIIFGAGITDRSESI